MSVLHIIHHLAAVSQSTTVDGPTTPTSKELFTKLKFNFYVESISATLYTGETNMVSANCYWFVHWHTTNLHGNIYSYKSM